MTETSYRLFVAVFLGSWLLLSILTVVRSSWVSGRRRRDVFHMLSDWRLFAGPDGAHPTTFPVLYRDRLRDGSVGPLRLADSGIIAWRPRIIFWYPAWDLQVMLRRLAKDLRKDVRARSRSCRHLAHVVGRYPPSSIDADARQFVILATHGELSKRPPAEIFQSDFHQL